MRIKEMQLKMFHSKYMVEKLYVLPELMEMAKQNLFMA